MEIFGPELWLILAVNLGVVFAAVILLWLVSIAIRDVSIIDLSFATILTVVATVAFLLGNGAAARKQLILVLVTVWAFRITFFLVKRSWGHGEDPRYTKLRGWVDDERAFIWLSLRKVFLLQGVVIWLVSLPIQVAQVYPLPTALGWPAFAGIALWLMGMFFEVVGDFQLARFRADPEMKGQVLQTGLWKYSRHPNYFGELCIWWGLFLIACDNPAGYLTIIGPIIYTYLIINVTGQRTLEKKLGREKPGYQAYIESTSGLIPMPPRN